MKKTIQIAFAISLVSIAIISTIWDSHYLDQIIYAVVVPSFILSIISFVADVSQQCESIALAEIPERKKDKNRARSRVYRLVDQYNTQSMKDTDKKSITQEAVIQARENYESKLNEALASLNICLLSKQCQIWCDRIMIVCYAFLILSLIFSPYISKWLSDLDSNCVTAWSLTLLYFTLELKEETAEYVYRLLCSYYAKKERRLYQKSLRKQNNRQ